MLNQLLKAMVVMDASDLYLVHGSPPVLRVHGEARTAQLPSLGPADVDAVLRGILSSAQLAIFDAEHELNCAFDQPGLGRFRVNVYRERGSMAGVFRRIHDTVPSLHDLGMPPIVEHCAMARRGLILVVGSAGSGKSTLLASMVAMRSQKSTGHILTIEDPIEFLHTHNRSLVTQREVGGDTNSFASALKNALRQAPDVIMIGEIRDQVSMEAALSLAEAGHLCVATLHANSADQAIERVMGFFPNSRHDQIMAQFALVMVAVFSVRLVPAVGGGRAAAVEALVSSDRIRSLLVAGSVDRIKLAMAEAADGSGTFDDALRVLVRRGRIMPDDAVANADSPNNLRLHLDQDQLKEGPADLPAMSSVRLRPTPAAVS